MINSLYDFEKLIKVNGPAYRGAKMPAVVDVAINESNIPDNMRLKHYRVDILDENSIQIYWQTQEPFTTDDAEKALEEIERAVNAIIKANDYTERVNVFVTFECRDGADEGYEDFTFTINDETKKENINIRESLNRLDAETYNKYDLLNTYDANPLDESKKQALAKMLNENKNAKSIYKFLNEGMHYPPEGGAIDLNKKEKRYPLWLYDKLEKAVASIDAIPEEHKEEFITLVGDRATTKNIPRIGYKAALLPKSLSTKFKKDGDADYMAAKDYNSLIARPEYYGTTIEEALIAIYEAMKNRWFKNSVTEDIQDNSEDVKSYLRDRLVDFYIPEYFSEENKPNTDLVVANLEKEIRSKYPQMIDYISYWANLDKAKEEGLPEDIYDIIASENFPEGLIYDYISTLPGFDEEHNIDESIDDDFDWSIYDDDSGYDDYEDDWEDSNLYGGDLTYCPVCNKSLAHDENGDSYCPECGESAFWLAQKRREMDKDLDETFSYEDDEFFTKEEIADFAEKVCDHVNETFNEHFVVQEYYLTNNKLDVILYNDELGEFAGTKKIDMRRIRKPSDLDKYVLDIAANIIADIKKVQGLEESVRYPNGEEVTDVDLDIALDYQYGTDRDPDNSKYTEEEKQKAINYWLKKTDPSPYDESLTEDTDDNGPYSYKETEAELQSLTQNWTREKDQLKCGYDEEKNYGMEILSKHGYECKADRQGGWWVVDYWKESLEESAKTWNDAYKEFQAIVDKYFPNEDEIESKVYDLYMANRLDPAYEEAYERWLDGNGESDANLDEDKESDSFKYDIEKLSNLGKYFNVTVSMFGDKLRVEGTAKDKNKFYEVAEEKGLLPETELSEDFKDDSTVKSLITDDRLSIVETDVIPNTTSFIAEYIEGDSQGTRFLFVLADDKGTEYTQNRTGEDSVNTPTEILEINGEDNVYFIFDLDSSTLGEAWNWEPEFKTEDGWTEEDIARWKEIDWEPLLKQHIGEVAVPEDNFIGKAVLYGDGYKPQYKQVKFVKKLHSNPIYPPNYEPEENPFPDHCGPMYDGTKHNGLTVHDRYETWANYDMLSR